MTIALEHIQEGDWAAVNRVVDTLRSLVPDTGGRSLGIRVGTGTATWTAATTSAAVTVTHGLGRTPVVVWLQEQDNFIRYRPSAAGATTLTVNGYVTSNTVGTFTLSFYWVVIG